jgi:hypothetical protein
MAFTYSFAFFGGLSGFRLIFPIDIKHIWYHHALCPANGELQHRSLSPTYLTQPIPHWAALDPDELRPNI